MLAKLKAHIEDNALLLEGERLLLTVSGGKDSVCMAHLFAAMNIPFSIAHCNFSLRGDESDGDEQFVRLLAEKWAVSFHVKHFDTLRYAQENGLSIQMAARTLRYEWFHSLGYDKIATAHHQDDAIETLLIKKSRKASLGALRGIAVKQNNVIRPMLCFVAKEVKEYVQAHAIDYREDSSNASIDYQRNALRLETLPALEKENPNIRQELLEEIAENERAYQALQLEVERMRLQCFKEQANGTKLLIAPLLKHPEKEAVVYELLKSFGPFSWKAVFDLLEAESGKYLQNEKCRLIKDRVHLLIVNRTEEIASETTVLASVAQISVPIALQFKILDTEGFYLDKKKTSAALDFDKLHFPLLLRPWKQGDSFIPLGMKGRKKLSDYMIDEKFSIPEKENTWVLCSKGEIVWVVGHRIDERYKLVPQTEKVYLVQPL